MNLDEPHKCPDLYCGHEAKPKTSLELNGPHYARAECAACGKFFDWIKKPDLEKASRPAAHRELVKKFGEGFCQSCLLREEHLPHGETLEGHHVIEFKDGGTSDRQNVWILCTACHHWIHWRRTNIGHILKTMKSLMELRDAG